MPLWTIEVFTDPSACADRIGGYLGLEKPALPLRSVGSPGFLDDDVSTLAEEPYDDSDEGPYEGPYEGSYDGEGQGQEQGPGPGGEGFGAGPERFANGSADEESTDGPEDGFENDYDGATADRKDGTK